MIYGHKKIGLERPLCVIKLPDFASSFDILTENSNSMITSQNKNLRLDVEIKQILIDFNNQYLSEFYDVNEKR